MKYFFLVIGLLFFNQTFAQFETTPDVAWRNTAGGRIGTWTQQQINGAGTWVASNPNGLAGAVRGVQDFYNNSNNLAEGECAPDFSTSSAAAMNSTCGSQAACQACYTEAKQKMDFFRRQLARLNCIYKNTTTFSASAISFGDTYSGFHAMSGVAWQAQRIKIMQSLQTLKQTYDRKYLEFIEGLKGSLMEFDACENQYGSGDWFEKSGFIYLEFMTEKYKRND
jgi:hypothetical protein